MNEEARRVAELIGQIFGVLLHLIVGVFYLTSGLVVPVYVLPLLWGIWIGLSVLMWRWRTRPVRVLAIPFLAAGIWWGVLTFGDLVLGWTA